MKKLIIFGNGKIADVAYTYFKADSVRDVSAFTVDRAFVREASWHGLPVVPFDEVESHFSPATHDMFVATGYQQLNQLRGGKCAEARHKGYTLASFCHSLASNPGGATIGPNTMILEHAVIQPGASVGWNTFVWSGNLIGHHAHLGNHAYIAGHCVISGGADIGDGCFIGVNATIGHEVTVGAGSVIGGGSLITKNVAPNSVHIMPDTPKFRLDAQSFLKLTRL